MKVFVFGALLVQTLNAQSVTGFNALAESEILNISSDLASDSADATASSTVDFGTLDLPTGTADVVLDPSSTPPTTTSDEPFGGGETAEPGVVFDGSEFNFPTPVSTADSTPTPIAEPLDAVDPLATSSPAPTGSASASSSAPLPTIAVLKPIEPSTATDPFITASEAFIMPHFGGTPTPIPGVKGAAAPEDTDPDSLDDDDSDEPTPNIPSLFLIRPTAIRPSVVLLGVGAQEATPIAVDSAAGALAGEEEGPEEFPGAWTGTDNGNYDGQDYGDNDEECPSYCYDNSDNVSDDDDDDDDDDGDSLMRRIVRWLRPRQSVPSSNGGFQSLKWPSDPSINEDCGRNIPAWLYELSGKVPASCGASKRACPASCYSSSSTSTEVTVETEATEAPQAYSAHSWKHPHHTPRPYSASPVTDVYEPYSTPTEYTTEDYTPYTTEDYTPYTTEDYTPYTTTDVPTTEYDNDATAAATSDSLEAETATSNSSSTYDSTTTTTRTTFITSTKTAEPATESSSAVSTDSDSADTLAGVCPPTCNPTDPLANKCDITTSCTTTGNGKYYCACRAGFRAGTWNAQDFTKQFKFDGQPYVYAAPGVVCDEVCDDQTCTEVGLRPQCQ
jgi:hypothetical protein